jgi:hypothetical protein
MDVRLKFINRSASGKDSEIVLLQKNVATGVKELATAWKVIRYCGYGWCHPIVYPPNFEVASSDDYGNYSPRIPVVYGQMLAVTPTASGRRLAVSGKSTSPLEVQVFNGLSRGAVNVNIFKGSGILSRKTALAPQQKAAFRFAPVLWIGAASNVVEGEAINSATMSAVNTQLPLFGIVSADIVMSGGGPDPDATAYAFTLENVVTA